MKFGRISVDEAEGAILAHSVAVEGRSWRKATVLGADDVAAMKAAGLNEVIAAVLEPGDVDENVAATQIADGLAAPGIEVRRAATGRVNLHAEKAGLLVVDRAAVDAINAIDPAITIATLPEFAPVSAGQMLATVKIIPFAVAGTLVERAAEKRNVDLSGLPRATRAVPQRRRVATAARRRAGDRDVGRPRDRQ